MSLSPTQLAFATSRDPFPAFIGGFGSGKTAAAIARAMGLKAHFKGCDIAYYLPTYPLVEDIAFRRFPDLCERKGWAYKLNKTSSFIEFPGSGRIVFRTMENPARIVGYEVAHSILDELDTLTIDKAREVWNKVIARNRQKCSMGNTVAVATTPEGFRFVYERWARKPAKGYVMFRAKTLDNIANLPAEYVDNLRASYPPQLINAYLEGEFVNLASGAVYPDFSRTLNHSPTVAVAREPLHIGLDFNVNKMAAVVFVVRDDRPHAVAELVKVRDTPTMAQLIRERFVEQGHQVAVYPDASGANTSSKGASVSDLTILQNAGLIVRAPSANPRVKDRVNSVNALILNDKGERRLRVNVDACPTFTEGLEQQPYDDKGEPDKTTGHDHANDAGGYFLHGRWPVVKPILAHSAHVHHSAR